MSNNQNSSGASSNPIFTEEVPVPRLLKGWCKGEECKKIIEDKKRIDDDIISIEYSESDKSKFIIKSKIETSAKLMKGVFQKLLDSQKSLTQKEKDIISEEKRISNQLYGMKQVEFRIEPDLMGYVLGKKFSNINEVKKQTGVESIVVDDYMSIIRIVGKDLKSCNLAREKLEVVEKTIEFPEDYTGLLVGSKGRNVRDYIEKSNVYLIQFLSGSAKIIGTKKSVNYAESLIMDDVSYYIKEHELKEKEDALYNKKLQFSTVKYNIDNKYDKYYQYYDMYVNDGVIVHQPEPRFRGYVPNNNRTTTGTNANTTTTTRGRTDDEERKVERNVRDNNRNNSSKSGTTIIQPTPTFRGRDSNGDVDEKPTDDKDESEEEEREDKAEETRGKEEYNRRGRSRGGRGGYRGGNRSRGGYRGGRDNYYDNNRNNETRGVTLRDKFQNNR